MAVVVIVVVAASVWLSKVVKHPEQTASHDPPSPDTTSERLYEGVDRPAGPDVDGAVDPLSPSNGHDPSRPES